MGKPQQNLAAFPMKRLLGIIIPSIFLAPALLVSSASAAPLDADLLCYMRTQAGQLLDLTPLCGELNGPTLIPDQISISPSGIEPITGVDAATREKEEQLVYSGNGWKSYINPNAVEVYNENRKFWVRNEPATPQADGLDSHMVFTVVVCSEQAIGETKELNYKADGSLINSATEMLSLRRPPRYRSEKDKRTPKDLRIIGYACSLQKGLPLGTLEAGKCRVPSDRDSMGRLCGGRAAIRRAGGQ